ncbi:Uncharacterised protein [Segatella copri]|nr:Uncharacterised protein [Segatella copri]
MVFLSFPRLKVYCPQHSSCGKHWPPEAGIRFPHGHVCIQEN